MSNRKREDNTKNDTSRVDRQERAPRIRMNTSDFNLDIPDGVIPEGYRAYWFLDDGKGRIQRAKAAYWEHAKDFNGANIERISGNTKQMLMIIEEKYAIEDDNLRMKEYRDSIGETDSRDIGVAGLETYTPNGEDNKIKVSKDPFAN